MWLYDPPEVPSSGSKKVHYDENEVIYSGHPATLKAENIK